MRIFKTKRCRIRKDLREPELINIPIGNTFVHGNGTFQYRWINPDTPHEQFQVKYCRKWVDAQSIDFDFIN